MLVKIAVNYDSSRHWRSNVTAALKAAGLGKHGCDYKGRPTGWDTTDVPRHHPVLIAALEADWASRCEEDPSLLNYPNDYIVEVELPSGRYLVQGEYRASDSILIPEQIAWVDVSAPL